MDDSLDLVLREQFCQRTNVDPGGFKQNIAEHGAAEPFGPVGHLEPGSFETDIANECISVAVQSVRGKTENHVALSDDPACDDLLSLDDANREAGHVEITRPIRIRHLSGFSAD